MARPAKFNPERRNAGVGVVRLPAEGRKGRAPNWPLPIHKDPVCAEREAELWSELWHTPQAVAWSKLGWNRTVARYCRMLVAAEQPGGHQHCKECKDEIEDPKKLDSSLLAQVTAMEDRLGLTPKAMRLMLWIIADDEVGEAREARRASGGRHLAAVDPSLLDVEEAQ